MQPFEFLIRSRPVSQQTRRKERLREWKDFVKGEASRYWQPDEAPANSFICITLVYVYDEVALDIDNVIKPIQDALVGLAFEDDSLVTDAILRRRQLRGTFDLTQAPPVLVEGFEYGDEFVYVQISDAPPQEQLL
ncbi:MAG: RusA family crossover junction endodeoxyribonuclease [Thermodesulfobacteriota bacterium]